MAKRVDVDDIIGVEDVAELVGLSQARNVNLYRDRHPDFPVPIWISRSGRCRAWSRREIQRWVAKRGSN